MLYPDDLDHSSWNVGRDEVPLEPAPFLCGAQVRHERRSKVLALPPFFVMQLVLAKVSPLHGATFG
jgi:hypothetical protein